MLARRSWATAELRERLLQRHETSEVDTVIAKLTRLGYLDDALRAEQYLATSRARERAARLLRSELIERGVGARVAEDALREHDDAEAALRAARRRLGALRGLDAERRARSAGRGGCATSWRGVASAGRRSPARWRRCWRTRW